MSSLTQSLPEFQRRHRQATPYVVGVLPGEGVGPEVISVALDVLHALSSCSEKRFELRMGGPIGNEALKLHGSGLTQEAVRFCDETFADNGALFCGPGGARFVYDLRVKFDLFCKFTPLQPLSALEDISIVRPERLKNIDIIAVRENVGGLYLGEWGRAIDAEGRNTAYQHFFYREDQIDRILQVAARLAVMRRGMLCLVLKREGVPAISSLWLERLERLRQSISLSVEILDIDNAIYQLIAEPQRFDVLVSSNMFGDVLADCGGLLLGSRGMSYSGNFDELGRAVYQTGHGAAYDIAGTDKANPSGQILALAMMLEESFGWPEGARAVRDALAAVLAQGYRTADIAGPGSQLVGTKTFGGLVCQELPHRVDGVVACGQPCY